MTRLTIEEYWNWLIERNVADEDELKLITAINGYSIETLNAVLSARWDYRDYEQYCKEAEIE